MSIGDLILVSGTAITLITLVLALPRLSKTTGATVEETGNKKNDPLSNPAEHTGTRPTQVYKAILQAVQIIKDYMESYELAASNADSQGSFGVIKCLEMLKCRGLCTYEVVPDSEMESRAKTSFHNKTISIADSIYTAAYKGALSAKFVIAHEIGHLMLHNENKIAACFDPTNINSSREIEASFFASRLFTREEMNTIRIQLSEDIFSEDIFSEDILIEDKRAEEIITANIFAETRLNDIKGDEATLDEEKLINVFLYLGELLDKAKAS